MAQFIYFSLPLSLSLSFASLAQSISFSSLSLLFSSLSLSISLSSLSLSLPSLFPGVSNDLWCSGRTLMTFLLRQSDCLITRRKRGLFPFSKMRNWILFSPQLPLVDSHFAGNVEQRILMETLWDVCDFLKETSGE